MTETPQELIARLQEYWEYDTGHIINSAIDCIAEQQAELAAPLAREAAETARCCRIINAARNGAINGDFRALLHFVNSGDQMLYVEAVGEYMHDIERADYETNAALEKEGGE